MLVPASIIEPNVGHASLAIPPVEEYDEELYILEVRFVDWNAGAKTETNAGETRTGTSDTSQNVYRKLRSEK